MKKPNHSDDGGTQNYDPSTGRYAKDSSGSLSVEVFFKSEADRDAVASIVRSMPRGLRALCERAITSGEVSFRESGKNEFRIASKTVCLNRASLSAYGLRMDDSPIHAPYFTFFHELGHAIDWTSSEGKRLSEGLREMVDLDLAKLEWEGETAVSAVNSFVEENMPFRVGESAEREAKRLIGAVSCAADIASYDVSGAPAFSYWDPSKASHSQVAYGHPEWYWSPEMRGERCECEVFANMVALLATEGKDSPAGKFMRKTFPLTYKNFLRILEGKEISAWI